MKHMYHKANQEQNAFAEIEKLYREIIALGANEQMYRSKLVDQLLRYQKEDGSWRVIDTLRGDSDYVIHYAFAPTYYATAALMYDMNCGKDENWAYEKNFSKGLDFITGTKGRDRRCFPGHGFDAERDVLEALNIYKDAGLYQWMQRYGDRYDKFVAMIQSIIAGYREALRTGETYGGFGENFEERFWQEVQAFDTAMMEEVWYVAYGSNLHTERFMEYIKVCSDPSAPTDDKAYRLPYDIYFAGKSHRWERKGVAYLDTSRPGKSFGKAYKIKRSQFDEIQQAEGASYSKCVFLGMLDDLPVYTFTAPEVRRELRQPCAAYVEVILKGLCETYPDRGELVFRKYLCDRGMINEDDRAVLEAVRSGDHGITIGAIAAKATNHAIGRAKTSVKRLVSYGFLQQDRRSISSGHDLNNLDAIVYTRKEHRELIDLIIL